MERNTNEDSCSSWSIETHSTLVNQFDDLESCSWSEGQCDSLPSCEWSSKESTPKGSPKTQTCSRLMSYYSTPTINLIATESATVSVRRSPRLLAKEKGKVNIEDKTGWCEDDSLLSCQWSSEVELTPNCSPIIHYNVVIQTEASLCSRSVVYCSTPTKDITSQSTATMQTVWRSPRLPTGRAKAKFDPSNIVKDAVK